MYDEYFEALVGQRRISAFISFVGSFCYYFEFSRTVEYSVLGISAGPARTIVRLMHFDQCENRVK